MNKSHKELIRGRYENAVHEYCHAFRRKHGYHYDPDGWVGEDVGGVLEVCDRYINMDDIRYDIDNDIKVGVLEEWYDYSTEIAFFEGGRNVNYPSWCRGYRPYSAEQLERISEAQTAVNVAKNHLRELVEQYKAYDL